MAISVGPSYLNQLQYIRNMDAFNEQPKLDMNKLQGRLNSWKAKRDADIQRRLAMIPGAQLQSVGGGGFNPNGFKPRGGGGDIERFINAIAGQESGGNYRNVNRSSRATGKYQLLPSNISEWSREVYGRPVSYNQFLNSPKIQEEVARHKLQQYVKQYGFAGAAAAWYGGPGAVKKMNSTKRYGGGVYPSISSYVVQVLRRMR